MKQGVKTTQVIDETMVASRVIETEVGGTEATYSYYN